MISGRISGIDVKTGHVFSLKTQGLHTGIQRYPQRWNLLFVFRNLPFTPLPLRPEKESQARKSLKGDFSRHTSQIAQQNY